MYVCNNCIVAHVSNAQAQKPTSTHLNLTKQIFYCQPRAIRLKQVQQDSIPPGASPGDHALLVHGAGQDIISPCLQKQYSCKRNLYNFILSLPSFVFIHVLRTLEDAVSKPDFSTENVFFAIIKTPSSPPNGRLRYSPLFILFNHLLSSGIKIHNVRTPTLKRGQPLFVRLYQTRFRPVAYRVILVPTDLRTLHSDRYIHDPDSTGRAGKAARTGG